VTAANKGGGEGVEEEFRGGGKRTIWEESTTSSISGFNTSVAGKLKRKGEIRRREENPDNRLP